MNALTDAEINVRIAEACGWTPAPDGRYTQDPAGLRGPLYRAQDLPDYANSLDAIHEAVKQCINTEALCETFVSALREIVNVNGATNALFRGYWGMGVCLLNATARQRALAFLKTIEPDTK